MSANTISPQMIDQVAQSGLPERSGPRQKVVIVGAGMAGLVAGYELLRAGHEPLILEARQRVGGRIETLREPFTHGLYAEAGAMRIPRTHHLTLGYCEKFGLTLRPFTMGNPRAYYYFAGRKFRAGEVGQNPELLPFDLTPGERGKSAGQLWREAIREIEEALRTHGEAAWTGIAEEFDQFSTREFLEYKGWSEGAIEMYGLMADQEALMNSSFLELLREDVGGFYEDMSEIEGGMDSLPRAFLPALGRNIRFGAKMMAMDQSPEGVIIHYQTGAGRFTAEGDYAIITVPFPVLRHVEVVKPFSRAKQRAIRQLHYDASAKIVMQFRRRFWEEDDGIYGGGTTSDLPIRATYYPDHSQETGRGVLLASYTWSEDAQRWGSLSPRDRIEQALENLMLIHPQVREEFEIGATKMWHDDEFAGGAFALFDPGQQTLLYQAIINPEGRIYFAGEHASLAHAWIQGAIESGLRTAMQVHQAAAGAG
ncbi:MAG: flavin monoamine oxidase family protein [Chloroflexi bacterium]|nr:flavin monoamine oxidase family protein [Chloroflexota bacterium]MCI0577911.1 flavin monoamine oxidase family protein [Chloroflexota bacterium]MCI0643518.1 flavin monoamine oxidase family protein [Chloroflexota bacterium]MCI0726626.1 flavin monoamine oxidase family protein [Chloroflexota bacterium]